MSRPSLAELRAVCQPAETMSRRNAEHWLARGGLRRVSLRVTALLIRTPVTANQLTGIMIVVGLLAAVPAALGGIPTAVLAVVLVLAYFLLDLCDGEVARWRRATSATGVYLDRVGHYLVEAALLCAYGLRAGGGELGGWSTLGVLGALLVVLVKAETDLVDVARTRKGLAAATDAAAELRSTRLGRLRRVAWAVRVHRVTGAVESVLLLLAAAAVDRLTGTQFGSRVLLVVLVAVAASQVVLHLLSVLASRRLS